MAVIVGAIAARSLERYKTRNALIQSTAGQRIDALHQLITPVGGLCDKVEELLKGLHDEMCSDIGVDPKTGLDASGVRPSIWGKAAGLDSYIEALMNLRRARIDELVAAIDRVDGEVRKHRFWIGGKAAKDFQKDFREFRRMLQGRRLRGMVLAYHLTIRRDRFLAAVKLVAWFVPYGSTPWSHSSTIDEAIRRLAR